MEEEVRNSVWMEMTPHDKPFVFTWWRGKNDACPLTSSYFTHRRHLQPFWGAWAAPISQQSKYTCAACTHWPRLQLLYIEELEQPLFLSKVSTHVQLVLTDLVCSYTLKSLSGPWSSANGNMAVHMYSLYSLTSSASTLKSFKGPWSSASQQL